MQVNLILRHNVRHNIEHVYREELAHDRSSSSDHIALELLSAPLLEPLNNSVIVESRSVTISLWSLCDGTKNERADCRDSEADNSQKRVERACTGSCVHVGEGQIRATGEKR